MQSHASTVRSLDDELKAIDRERSALPAGPLVGALTNAVNRLDGKLARLEQARRDVPTSFAAASFLLGRRSPGLSGAGP